MRSSNSGEIHGRGQMNLEQNEYKDATRKAENELLNSQYKIKLPMQESNISHIFGNREGHLPDTLENRKMFLDLANDTSKKLGIDKYGNSWNAETNENGQVWVRYRCDKINECGLNKNPREWDDESGLNNNPKKNNTWRKKK